MNLLIIYTYVEMVDEVELAAVGVEFVVVVDFEPTTPIRYCFASSTASVEWPTSMKEPVASWPTERRESRHNNY